MIGKRLVPATAIVAFALSLGACGGDSASGAVSTVSGASASSNNSASTSTPVNGASGTTTTTTPTTTSGTTTTTVGKPATTTATPSTTSGKTTTTPVTANPTPATVKSIKQWVSCSETLDETNQLAAAITAAAHNAFVLQIDCPVRLHTGAAALTSISVPDGVTIKFSGAGEFLMVSNGPPAMNVAHPQEVTFVDYNQTFL